MKIWRKQMWEETDAARMMSFSSKLPEKMMVSMGSKRRVVIVWLRKLEKLK